MPKESYTIRERLDELYRRLHGLPPTNSADLAFQQLCDTLNQVEDELSGITKQTPPPTPSMSDGRMYCPVEDHILKNVDGSILALTRGHRIEVASDGSIRIINRVTEEVEFEQ